MQPSLSSQHPVHERPSHEQIPFGEQNHPSISLQSLHAPGAQSFCFEQLPDRQSSSTKHAFP